MYAVQVPKDGRVFVSFSSPIETPRNRAVVSPVECQPASGVEVRQMGALLWVLPLVLVGGIDPRAQRVCGSDGARREGLPTVFPFT